MCDKKSANIFSVLYTSFTHNFFDCVRHYMVFAYINPRSYRSLAEFFTRSLRDDVRLIDPISCIVSPCDGRVLHFGSATSEQIEQV